MALEQVDRNAWVGIVAASAVFVAATFVLAHLLLPDERDFIARMNIGQSMGGAALVSRLRGIGALESSAGLFAGGVDLIAIFALLAYALWRSEGRVGAVNRAWRLGASKRVRSSPLTRAWLSRLP